MENSKKDLRASSISTLKNGGKELPRAMYEQDSSKSYFLNAQELFESVISPSIPKESQITCARFEGPNIALYTLNPKFSLTELTYYLSSISRSLKKRFILRTDPSIRLSEDETRSAVVKMLPSGTTISAVFCDDATGEVILI